MMESRCLMLLPFLGCLAAQAQTFIFVCPEIVGSVLYVDSTRNASMSQNIRVKSISQSTDANDTYVDRVFSREGKIAVKFKSDQYLTPAGKHCFKQVMDMWENKINIGKNIKIAVDYDENMPIEHEIETTVSYQGAQVFSGDQMISYCTPATLETGEALTTILKINPNVYWDYSWPTEFNYGYDNFKSALLRHFAHALGFGTSLTYADSGLRLTVTKTPSFFDDMISDDEGNKLSSLARRPSSSRLQSFMKKDLFLCFPSGKKIRLYTSSQGYVPYRSCNYFMEPSTTLMSYPYADKTKLYSINKETLDALDAIHWDVKPHDLRITSTSLDNLGYGYAHLPIEFNAYDESELPVADAQWTYQLFDKEKKVYVDYAKGSGSTFSVSPEITDTIYIDEFKSLQAQIICKSTDGKEASLPLSLEMRPQIIDCKVSNVAETSDEYYFSCDMEISSAGGYKGGYLTVCNEGGGALVYSLKGDNETIHIPSLFKYSKVWIDVSLKNEYGSSTKRYYYTYPQSLEQKSVSAIFVETGNGNAPFDAYTLQGRKVGTFTNLKELPKGIYIIKKTNDPCTTQKIIIK